MRSSVALVALDLAQARIEVRCARCPEVLPKVETSRVVNIKRNTLLTNRERDECNVESREGA